MSGSNILTIWDAALSGGKGDYRSLTVADLVAAVGSATDPSIVQGTDGAGTERLATFAEQEAQSAKLDAILANARTVFGFDLYLDGGAWKVALFQADGTTQIISTTLGTVAVGADSSVTFPLDLSGLGGSPATEIRCHGAGQLKVRYSSANVSFPVSPITVKADEVKIGQFTEITSIDAAIARIHISWGG